MTNLLLVSFVLLVSVTFNQVTAIDAPLVGGFSPLNAAEYTDKAWKSVKEINGKTNGKYYLVPIKVVKAQVQVVAGTNTELEVLVGESSCETAKQPVSRIAAANCGPRAHGARALYRVSIWEKSWEHFEQITAEKIRDVADGEHF